MMKVLQLLTFDTTVSQKVTKLKKKPFGYNLYIVHTRKRNVHTITEY